MIEGVKYVADAKFLKLIGIVCIFPWILLTFCPIFYFTWCHTNKDLHSYIDAEASLFSCGCFEGFLPQMRCSAITSVFDLNPLFIFSYSCDLSSHCQGNCFSPVSYNFNLDVTLHCFQFRVDKARNIVCAVQIKWTGLQNIFFLEGCIYGSCMLSLHIVQSYSAQDLLNSLYILTATLDMLINTIAPHPRLMHTPTGLTLQC